MSSEPATSAEDRDAILVIAWVHKLPCFKTKGWWANFKSLM